MAEELGIDTNTVCRWIRELEKQIKEKNKEIELQKKKVMGYSISIKIHVWRVSLQNR